MGVTAATDAWPTAARDRIEVQDAHRLAFPSLRGSGGDDRPVRTVWGLRDELTTGEAPGWEPTWSA